MNDSNVENDFKSKLANLQRELDGELNNYFAVAEAAGTAS
jgi:hypothetical protein